jgi:uncharacterized membrane protein YbhN (UPF0104 family)
MMKRLAETALKIAVSATLLWILFHQVALSLVMTDLGRFGAGSAVLVLGLGLLQILLFAARWQRVGRICGAVLPWGANLRLIFIGLFFNQTLPSSIGGDAVRVWLAARLGAPAGSAFCSVAVDRFVALILLLGLSLATLPLFYQLVGNPILRHSLTLVLAAGGIGFIALLAAGPRVGNRLQSWRGSAPFGAVIIALRRLFLQPAGLGIVLLSLTIHLMSVAIVLLIARGLGIGLSAGAALVLVPPILLVLVIPVTIAGWGLRESAVVVGLAQIHIAAPDALAISILFGLLQIAVSLPGAVLWLQRPERLRPVQGL